MASAIGPIKVNLEFSFSFAGCSFFGSEHKHLFEFQTWDWIHISISDLIEKKIQNLGFDSSLVENKHQLAAIAKK